MEEKLFQVAENCVGDLVRQFQTTPYFFYTEADMHCYLYSRLLRKVPRMMTDFGVKTSLLHKEYPPRGTYRRDEGGYLRKATKGVRGRFDIVLLDPNEAMRINSRNLRIGGVPVQPLVAMELALNNCRPEHLLGDFVKLTHPLNKVRKGYLLTFFRDFRSRKITEKGFVQELKKRSRQKHDVELIMKHVSVVPTRKKNAFKSCLEVRDGVVTEIDRLKPFRK